LLKDLWVISNFGLNPSEELLFSKNLILVLIVGVEDGGEVLLSEWLFTVIVFVVMIVVMIVVMVMIMVVIVVMIMVMIVVMVVAVVVVMTFVGESECNK
jgi:hypothetical protein